MDENNVKINEKKETKNIKIGVVLSYVRLIILVAVSMATWRLYVKTILRLTAKWSIAASLPGLWVLSFSLL